MYEDDRRQSLTMQH